MFIPESYGLALLLMILCMICWRSWANTYKLTRSVRFELFYWDYAVGIFMMADSRHGMSKRHQPRAF